MDSDSTIRPAHRVAIIDSGGANISSIVFAFERLGCQPTFTGDWDVIQNATHVVLPGVGSAGAAMNRLHQLGLVERIPTLTQPVVGICLGMQLLFAGSEEGGVAGLGIVPATISRIPRAAGLTVPHTGWNRNRLSESANRHEMFRGMCDNFYSYFVHSYCAPLGPWTIAESQHGIRFSSMVAHQNFTGIQFHPERSSAIGHDLLKRFLKQQREQGNA